MDLSQQSARLLILYAEEMVRQRMSGLDPTHDDLHIFRVRRMAKKISNNLISRSYPVNPLVVELAALFHDMCDHKYVESEEEVATTREELESTMSRYGLEEKTAKLVMKIIDNVSYSKEIRLRQAGEWTKWHDTCLELHCVQDADRLDAMGAMGVLRAAGFSAVKNQPLYHSNQSVQSTYKHFHDKLLKLKDTMKTYVGKKVAVKRHEIMVNMVSQIDEEVNLRDFDF